MKTIFGLHLGAFARGVGVLVGGTAGAQVLMLLASPILTRLYSPEDFGVLAIFISLLSIFTVVASLRYQLAIPLPKSDQDAANITLLSILLVVCMALLSSVILVFTSDYLIKVTNAAALESIIWIMPLSVFFIGCYQVFSFWAVRKSNFGLIARTKIKQSVVTVSIQLLGSKYGAAALITGHSLGQGMGGVGLALNSISSPEFRRCKMSELKEMAVRYRRFPFFSTWEALLNTAGVQLPPLLFALLFSPVAAGFYALAHRVLAMPIALIGDAVGKVFFSKASQALRDRELGNLVADVYIKLMILALPGLILIAIAGPHLFSFVFGPKWMDAGTLASWMSPWLFFVFVSSPLTPVFAIMEQQKKAMFFQVILLISRIIAISVGFYFDLDIVPTIILYSLFSSLCWVGFLVWVFANTGANGAFLLKKSLFFLSVVLAYMAPLAVGINYTKDAMTLTILLVLSLVCVSAYYLVNLKTLLKS